MSEQLNSTIIVKDILKDTKVSVSVFSADISKSEDISRWRLIDKALHCDFSATKTFSKIRYNFLSEGLNCFQQLVQQEAKRSILQDYEETLTDTQTDCYNVEFPT